MRVKEQSSLAVTVGQQVWHLVVGVPHLDGSVPCHLMAEEPSTATYQLRLHLDGTIEQASVLVGIADHDAEALAALAAVQPAVWRGGLATGLRRRLSVLRSFTQDGAAAAGSVERMMHRTQAMIAALECDNPNLRPALTALAPTWAGMVTELYATAQAGMDASEGDEPA